MSITADVRKWYTGPRRPDKLDVRTVEIHSLMLASALEDYIKSSNKRQASTETVSVRIGDLSVSMQVIGVSYHKQTTVITLEGTVRDDTAAVPGTVGKVGLMIRGSKNNSYPVIDCLLISALGSFNVEQLLSPT